MCQAAPLSIFNVVPCVSDDLYSTLGSTPSGVYVVQWFRFLFRGRLPLSASFSRDKLLQVVKPLLVGDLLLPAVGPRHHRWKEANLLIISTLLHCIDFPSA